MRETLLFYCQHSLGIGHLTRSFALSCALRERFRVVFLNGGPLPDGIEVPQGVECIDLPPLGMDDSHTVISRDAGTDVQTARVERRRLIDRSVTSTKPALLLVELFPFGRKKFANEILPMIRAARGQGARVVCSLRDILVDVRRDQQHHDDRARWLANRYFDAVIVHADPAFATLQDSFRPTRPMRTPVWYSGFVVPRRRSQGRTTRGEHLLVSAGGGIVGDALFRAAIDAHRIVQRPMRIVAGPFLPEAQWQALRALAAPLPGVALVRHVSDLAAEMRGARASISQCGYNTALDILVSRVPGLVVPYATATENEQGERAARLASLGVLQRIEPAGLDAARMADAIGALLNFRPAVARLGLEGAADSARRLRRLWQEGAPCTPA
jgi:predicted glycosyltransferase